MTMSSVPRSPAASSTTWTRRCWAFIASGGLYSDRLHIFERTRPNGTVLEIRTVPLPDGSAVRTYTDITARRRAEADLRAKTAVLDATLEHLDQGLMMFDEHSVVRVCNERAITLLDLPPDMMRAEPTFEEVRRFQLDRNEFAKSDPTLRQWVETSGERSVHIPTSASVRTELCWRSEPFHSPVGEPCGPTRTLPSERGARPRSLRAKPVCVSP